MTGDTQLFVVRPVRSDELDKVMRINLETLPENYSREFYLYIYRGWPDLFLVAEVDGEVVGYIMCRVERGYSEFSRFFKPVRKGHVISIAVLPGYRRMGIGTALMKKALLRMAERGVDEVYLEVRISNIPAINMYKKLGFRIMRTLWRYYRDGENAYLMARPLK